MSYQTTLKKVAILSNPKAGNGNSLKTANWLAVSLSDLKIDHDIYPENWPAVEMLSNYSDCWIIGGDGTINYFINQYPNCKVNLALFDGGTGNDFAWKLYGDSNLSDRFKQVIHASPKSIDAGKVNNKLYINCMGVGFDGEIIKSMKAIRFLGGKLGYMLAVIIKIFNFKEKKFSIQSNETILKGKYLLLFIVNSSRAGGGFYIAPNAEVNDGLLNMVLCKSLPIWKRLIYLPIIKAGKHMNLSFVNENIGTSFKIKCDYDLPIQVDGELIFANEMDVKILPSQFSFRY